MNKELEAFYKIKAKLIKVEGNTTYGSIIDLTNLDTIEKSLKAFEELKKGIEWRIAEYKKELDSGVDCDGVPLSETNRKIVLNLYNIMCALESYYKEN